MGVQPDPARPHKTAGPRRRPWPALLVPTATTTATSTFTFTATPNPGTAVGLIFERLEVPGESLVVVLLRNPLLDHATKYPSVFLRPISAVRVRHRGAWPVYMRAGGGGMGRC